MSKSGLNVLHDMWSMMREYVNPDDVTQLADNVVMMLMEADYELADIRAAFDSDADIMEAVRFYSEETTDDYGDEEDDFDFDTDNDYDE